MDCTAIPPVAGAALPTGEPLEDWGALISELLDNHGMSQPQIAAFCHCSQSTVSDLARGETKDPRHRIGEALRALRMLKRREAAEKAVPLAAPANGADAGPMTVGM